MICAIMIKRRSESGKRIRFATHAMFKVIFTVVLIACLYKSTAANEQQAHQDRKQRDEIDSKLSNNQYYLKNATSDKQQANQNENTLVSTSKTNFPIVAGGRAHVGDEQVFITSTSSVSSTTNVVTSPTSSSSAELTSPSIQQATLLSSRKQEDSKQLQANHQTTAASNSSARSLMQQRQEHLHAKQHRVSPTEKHHLNELRQQSAHSNEDPIYQASTSQSVTIAEPEMAASNQEQHLQQQRKQQKSPGGNRWTHFGARLRPLTTSGMRDHNEAASKSLPAIVYNGNTVSNNNNMQQQRSQLKQAGSSLPLNTNQVGDGDEDDDLNDDQDSEALLYKMMQQQGFLMGSPLWQQQLKPGSNQAASSADSEGAQLINGDDGRESVGNSKKVIKLLKSYSHIHQVDDSDDQIRGTYTRLPVRRPAVNDNGWQPTNGGQQQHNRNRLPSNGRQQQAQSSRQQPHHIFVSSQPLAKAYSQPSVRNQQLPGGNPDGGDSENYPQAGTNPQYNSPYGGEDGGDPNAQGGPPPEEEEFECPNNGIFADEASGCESYHVCQSGAQVQQKFQCPKGTLFNNIILTCDFAHNVQCNKNKDANAPRPEEQQDPQNYPPQPQQVPRASIQVNQNSYVQQPRQQQQQHQHQVNSQGPRHLKIGSQYSQHQQNQQSSLAQAVSSYPPPKPTPASSSSDSDDDSDDDPLVPLVPATLPPRVANLPYNPPPVASHPAQQANLNHQSAHRSQYPNQYQAGYQQNGRAFGSYDGDSAVSPVFASHDEATRTTEATTATRSYAAEQPLTIANKQSSDAQSFNLVINHLTPAKQHQQPLKSNIPLKPAAINNSYNKKLANQAKHSQLVPANLPLASYNKNEPKQQQHYLPAVNKQTVINPHQSAANRDVLTQSNRQPIHHHNARINNYDNHQQHHHHHHHHQQPQQQRQLQYQRQPMATQIKPVHVDAGQPMPLRAALVDLTNDKKSGGVSSEALNDGLLLIVRHSPAASQADVSHSAPDVNKAYATDKRVGAKPAASSGQAYALDPSIVRPNSPVDAQLFPNVQRVIATSQGGNQHHYSHNHNYNSNNNNNNNKQQQQQHTHNHQAAQSVHHAQHAVAPSQAQQATNPIRVSPPLPPMEPPKPVITGNENEHYNNAELQIVASSSHLRSSPSSDATLAPSSSAASAASAASAPSPSTSTSSNPTEQSPISPNQSKRVASVTTASSTQQKSEILKQRTKRMKRLKAAQQPPTLESSPIVDAKLTKVTATNQSQKKELKSKPNAANSNAAANQPVTSVTVDQQRRAGY